MLYRNVKNGSVLDLTSGWGPNWEPVKSSTARKTAEKKTEPAKKKGMTKK